MGYFELIAGPTSNSYMIISGLMVSPFKDAMCIVLKLSQGFYIFAISRHMSSIITSCGHTHTCIHMIYITYIFILCCNICKLYGQFFYVLFNKVHIPITQCKNIWLLTLHSRLYFGVTDCGALQFEPPNSVHGLILERKAHPLFHYL